jgi:hypothetical protein
MFGCLSLRTHTKQARNAVYYGVFCVMISEIYFKKKLTCITFMAKVRHYIQINCELRKNTLHFTFSILCMMTTVGLHCNKSLNIAEIN